jgi:hypothetical protein
MSFFLLSLLCYLSLRRYFNGKTAYVPACHQPKPVAAGWLKFSRSPQTTSTENPRYPDKLSEFLAIGSLLHTNFPLCVDSLRSNTRPFGLKFFHPRVENRGRAACFASSICWQGTAVSLAQLSRWGDRVQPLDRIIDLAPCAGYCGAKSSFTRRETYHGCLSIRLSYVRRLQDLSRWQEAV